MRFSFHDPVVRFLGAVLLSAGFVGCVSYNPLDVLGEPLSWQLNAPSQKNPMYVTAVDHEQLWATVYDVMGNHFEIDKSDPIRLYEGVLTEGRLTTKPKVAPSLLEPWHRNSGSLRERCDSTLQSMRHRALVRIAPEQNGFNVEIRVYKEIEALRSPVGATASSGNMRFDGASGSVNDLIDVTTGSPGWNMAERDYALEGALLGEILYRLDHPPKTIHAHTEPIRG